MKRALIRLEDIQPGSIYGTEEALMKLKAIGDYLKSENVPFQMSVIPRSVLPSINYDKSIADTADPFIKKFNNTIRYLQKVDDGAVGIHGYTHQFGNSDSASGFEFYNIDLKEDVPPHDKRWACCEKEAFEKSYAYSRMKAGYEAFKKAGINIDWGFSTPHYAADWPERNILEAWCGLFYEPDPSQNQVKRSVIIKDTDSAFYRGVIYVPTPLDYVHGENPEVHVKRISEELNSYTEEDLASFFYHPYLDFPFIEITDSGIHYNENSYLKQLIRIFKSKGFTFVPILSLVNFIPSAKAVNVFPGNTTQLFLSDIDGDGKDEFIGWHTDTGIFQYSKVNIEKFPVRLFEEVKNIRSLGLSKWVIGTDWKIMFGDFNGDGKKDVLAWNTKKSHWKAALSNGTKFIPNKKFADFKWTKEWKVDKNWVPLIGDFNGDGMDDILMWNPVKGQWRVALSNGRKFKEDTKHNSSLWLENWGIGKDCVPLAGDFNGDGKTDIALWDPYKGNWIVSISNGSKFIPHEGMGDFAWLKSWALGILWKPMAADFDGDGTDDILAVDYLHGLWQVALSKGNQFVPANNVFKYWSGGQDMQPFAADINGCGKAALLARHPNERNGSIDCAVPVFKIKD
ncbi:MAG: hypothetical protein K0R54_2309 [Clostridiaceae bacterium]|jgi:hypothetical protein|nr:hypothetical protein [Clostridiaceae bacterium]